MTFVLFLTVCTAQIVMIQIYFLVTSFLNFTPCTFKNAASTPVVHTPQHRALKKATAHIHNIIKFHIKSQNVHKNIKHFTMILNTQLVILTRKCWKKYSKIFTCRIILQLS
jgi:hypothetical protein